MSNERILIVDDEPSVLTFTSTVLGKKGYEVFTASDAAAALGIAERLACSLNLLLTDIVMPGMKGDELVRSIRQMCPYVDVLVMTGALGEQSQGLVNCQFLKKPFTPTLLLRTVQEIIGNQLH